MTLPQKIDDLTTLLGAWSNGDGRAFDALAVRTYDELKRIAEMRLRKNFDHAISPTEVLHEAVIRIAGQAMSFNDRAHFFAVMSLQMRAVLVDHARARMADKRGDGAAHIAITTRASIAGGEESVVFSMLAIDEALTQLEALDARCAGVLHLTYFAGLSREDIAEVMAISVPTVDRDLKFARAWLNTTLDMKLH